MTEVVEKVKWVNKREIDYSQALRYAELGRRDQFWYRDCQNTFVKIFGESCDCEFMATLLPPKPKEGFKIYNRNTTVFGTMDRIRILFGKPFKLHVTIEVNKEVRFLAPKLIFVM